MNPLIRKILVVLAAIGSSLNCGMLAACSCAMGICASPADGCCAVPKDQQSNVEPVCGCNQSHSKIHSSCSTSCCATSVSESSATKNNSVRAGCCSHGSVSKSNESPDAAKLAASDQCCRFGCSGCECCTTPEIPPTNSQSKTSNADLVLSWMMSCKSNDTISADLSLPVGNSPQHLHRHHTDELSRLCVWLN